MMTAEDADAIKQNMLNNVHIQIFILILLQALPITDNLFTLKK